MTTPTYKDTAEDIRRDPKRRREIERDKAAMRAGIRLYEARRSLGLSQAELAKRLELTQERVSAIERAEDLKLTTLTRYVEALGGELRVLALIDGETIELTPRAPIAA